MSQPQVTIFVENPGPSGESSYFDITISGNPYLANLGKVDAWCADTDTGISKNTTYTATVYSSYEANSLATAFPTVQNQQNLDLINWIINQNFTADPQYNYGEVQAAIWTLLGDSYNPNGADLTAKGPVLQADVNAIIALAQANGENFVPDNNQYIAVMLNVVDSNGRRKQPIVAQIKAAKLGDYVWEDSNADGIQDTDENGIAGVTVNLGRDLNNDGDIKDTNEILATTVTDSTGYYIFKGLTPSLEYQVEFIKPTGFDAVSPRQASASTPANDSDGLLSDKVILSPGEFNQTLDAGFYKYASLGDKVFLDTNANGVQDAGENGVEGVTVNLFKADGTAAGTATTDSNGIYNFTGLVPGDYYVEFVKPNGYNFSPQDQGANDATDSDANINTGKTITTNLESGENDLTWDAGLYQTASLGDQVFLDTNANGVQDAGENGVEGVTVNLFKADGSAAGTATTDSNGIYNFTGLVPGDYYVEFVKPNGYNFSSQDQGANDATDSDADTTTGQTITTNLESGENDLTWDAGLYQTASLGDKVFLDTNANGIQDAGENGVQGVTVNLYQADGTAAGTATTNSNGIYNFTGLVPGDYYVEFVKPNGYSFSPQDQGANDATDSDANTTTGKTITTNLVSGENDLTWDAGLYQTASIGDKVFLDANANGIQDAGEAGVEGVTVNLFQGDGTAAGTTTTDSNGIYNFTGLVPGDYYVEFVKPDGYNFSTQDQGANDATDSDANTTTGKTITTNLVSGENDTTWDAGLYVPQAQVPCVCTTITFTDTSNCAPLDGTNGNIRTFTQNGISVKASAFSRDKTYGTWQKAYLGLYGQGLGVTDSSEGNGSNGTHRVDNIGRDNYVLFEFSSPVTVDQAFLNSVVTDSDISVWIGNFNNPFNNHLSLNDSLLNGMSNETNLTNSSLSRWADINSNEIVGNTLVIAGWTGDTSPEDAFKINKLDVCQSVCANASLGDFVWYDVNANGIQDANESGVAGVKATLSGTDILGNSVTVTDVTDSAGEYLFANLLPGNYKVTFNNLPAQTSFTSRDRGTNDAKDSDVDPVTGMTQVVTLAAGEVNRTLDAGLVSKPCVPTTIYFSGSSALDGTNGNIRTFTQNGVSVKASAFSRDKLNGSWSPAYLGLYGQGLGVTDSSEGDGSNGRHRVDNIGRDNYVLFEFSSPVTVDEAFLNSVVTDSDISVWIGNSNDPFNNHLSLNDSLLNGMYTEVNTTASSSYRWADLNSGQKVGNILVIAGWTGDTSPEDAFKINALDICAPANIC